MRTRNVIALVLFSVLPFTFAHGADGIREINQACASSSDGCFPGDGQGFPVQITESGSYVLTGNLSVMSNVNGIEIFASDVTVDLNGFTLAGPSTCEGDGVDLVCSAATFFGGLRSMSNASRIAVLNGVVRGFGTAPAVGVGAEARIRNLTVTENAGSGIFASTGSYVMESIVSRNQSDGITGSLSVADGVLVLNNVVKGNKGDGISVTQGAVHGNLVLGNGGVGIDGGQTIIGNSVFFSSSHGIVGRQLVVHNGSSNNTGDQIKLSSAGVGLVMGNTASNSSPFGPALNLSADISYIDNAIKGTATGGIDLSGNRCNGDPCP